MRIVSPSWVALLGLCVCNGCGPSPSDRPTAPILPASTLSSSRPHDASTPATDMLDHPEYVNWSQFSIGASVTRKRLVTNAFGEVTVTTRTWLEDKTEEFVNVGTQVTVERSDQPIEKNPDQFTRFVARFQIPQGMDSNTFVLPSIHAKRLDDETQRVGDRELITEVYEWQESNESGPMTVKLWRSNDVPGRIVRQEMLTLASDTKTMEEIVEVQW